MAEERLEGRSDIVAKIEPELVEALAGARQQAAAVRAGTVEVEVDTATRTIEQAAPADAVAHDLTVEQKKNLNKRKRIRKTMVEAGGRDPNGFERIIGESDLTSINFLARGMRAAEAVCRIRVPGPGGQAFGSGFLCGPGLLITNNHVLGNTAEASQAEAEFNFEHDADGVLGRPIQFNLQPEQIFFTDAELDFTIVAIAPHSDSGVAAERFGFIPLLPMSGKGLPGERVSIIQHPGGQPKQIAIRANKIIELAQDEVPNVDLTKFIHYVTDTDAGSSGSPVLNDQWQAVALHHKAVPAPNFFGPSTVPVWLANEGVRISAIFNRLERDRFSNQQSAQVLERLEQGLGIAPSRSGFEARDDCYEKDRKPFKESRWQSPELGYDADFLSENLPLAPIVEPLLEAGDVAPLNDGEGDRLDYRHFSVYIHEKRKFALMTAVNIDGNKFIHPGSRSDAWRQDLRMDGEYQPAGNFYERKLADEAVYFSRGHLVRRFDPCWGDSKEEARLAEADTFHYANAAPQHQRYNNVDWGDLEDALLDRAQSDERKMSVLTGPIFGDNDPVYGRDREGGPWRIPLTFWKIIMLQKTPDTLAIASFMVGQVQYVKALYEARVFSSLSAYTREELAQIQTTVGAIGEATGLDFSSLEKFDVQAHLESTRQTRWLHSAADAMI